MLGPFRSRYRRCGARAGSYLERHRWRPSRSREPLSLFVRTPPRDRNCVCCVHSYDRTKVRALHRPVFVGDSRWSGAALGASGLRHASNVPCFCFGNGTRGRAAAVLLAKEGRPSVQTLIDPASSTFALLCPIRYSGCCIFSYPLGTDAIASRSAAALSITPCIAAIDSPRSLMGMRPYTVFDCWARTAAELGPPPGPTAQPAVHKLRAYPLLLKSRQAPGPLSEGSRRTEIAAIPMSVGVANFRLLIDTPQLFP